MKQTLTQIVKQKQVQEAKPNEGLSNGPSYEGFTENERLLGEHILLSKVTTGLITRITNETTHYLINNNGNEFFEHLSEYIKALEALKPITPNLCRKYAIAIGISRKRYKEIWDYVYSHETKI